MKKSFTKKLSKAFSALVVAAACSHGPTASAAIIGVNPLGTGPGGGYTATDNWTNLTDSALALNFNPNILIPPGAEYDIRLISQARVGTFSLGSLPVLPGGIPNIPNFTYEVTKILDINERVIANSAPGPGLANANFGMTTQTADLDPITTGLQQLAIYFDTNIADGSQAVAGDGAGTVRCYGAGPTSAGCGPDGVLALSGHLVSNVSSFSAAGAVGTGSFDLRFVIDYANPAFLDITTGSVFGDIFTGTTNFPSFFNPFEMWNGVDSSTGILLKVDSSQNFIAAVPEPGSLALLGLGLASFGAALARRRKVTPA